MSLDHAVSGSSPPAWRFSWIKSMSALTVALACGSPVCSSFEESFATRKPSSSFSGVHWKEGVAPTGVRVKSRGCFVPGECS